MIFCNVIFLFFPLCVQSLQKVLVIRALIEREHQRHEKNGHHCKNQCQRGSTFQIIFKSVSTRFHDHDLAWCSHRSHDGNTACSKNSNYCSRGSIPILRHAEVTSGMKMVNVARFDITCVSRNGIVKNTAIITYGFVVSPTILII